MATSARSRPRVSLWVVVVLLAAVGIGAAAALLTAPVAPTPPTYFYTPFDISITVAGWLVIGFVLVWLVVHMVERQRHGSALIPGRTIAVALLAILLAVAFVFLARAYSPGAQSGGGMPEAGGTGTPPTATLNNSTNFTVNSTGFAPLHFGGWAIPGWAVLAAIVGFTAVVGIIAVPLYLARQHRLAVPDTDEVAGGMGSEFAAALRTLNDPDGGDVREIIIHLYARLLVRIGPVLGDLDAHAPREIERACVEVLRIRPETAHALTGLFEEARYSTHRLDAATGARAREIFRQALADLDATVRRAS